MEVVGNDLYMLKETKSLRLEEIEAITTMYQPLLSSRAICLYFSLLKMPISTQPYDTHSHLCERMNCSISELIDARKELEHYLLLKSYVTNMAKSNVYIYEVKRPLTKIKFLKHDVFSRILVNKVGNDYIERISKDIHELKDYSNYTEITELMNISLESWTDFKEEEFQAIISSIPEKKRTDVYQVFDIISYLKRHDANEFQFKWSKWDKKCIDRINELGQYFKLTNEQMIIALNGAYSVKTYGIDFSKLEDLCRMYSTVEFKADINDDPLKYALSIHPRKILTDGEKNDILVIKEKYASIVSNETINNAISSCISNTREHHIVLNYISKVIDGIINEKNKKVTSKPSTSGKRRRVEEIPIYSEPIINETIDENQIKANLELLKRMKG